MTTPISIFYTGGTSTVAMDIVSFSYPYVAAANPEGQPVLVNVANPYQPVGSSYDFNANFTYTPVPPTVVQRFAQVVVVKVPYLYIVVGSNELNVSRTQQLNVYDLSNPTPQLLSTTTLTRPPKNYILSSGALYDKGSAQYLVVAGNRAAGSTAEYGQLYIVDITDPYTPIDVGLRRFDDDSTNGGQFLKQIRISGNDFYFITHNSDTHKVTVNPNRFPTALEYGLQNIDLGGWDASTNTPALNSIVPIGVDIGSYYTATVAGTTVPNAPFLSATAVAVGDRIVVDYQNQWSLDTYTEPPRRTYVADPVQTANTLQLLGDYLVMGWNGATAGAACVQVLERNAMQLLARYTNDDPRATGAWWNGDSIYLAGFGSTPTSSIFAIKIKSLTPGPVVTASVIAGQANIATSAFIEGTCNSGAVSTRSLLVAGPALIDDKLVVDGPVCGTGSMEVGGDTTLDGKLTVNTVIQDTAVDAYGVFGYAVSEPGGAAYLLQPVANGIYWDFPRIGLWPQPVLSGSVLSLNTTVDAIANTPDRGTITVLIPGTYRVGYNVTASPLDDGATYRFSVKKNGVPVQCSFSFQNKLNGRSETMSSSCIMPLLVNDVVELAVRSDENKDLNIYSYTLSVERMRLNTI